MDETLDAVRILDGNPILLDEKASARRLVCIDAR
jgi:hypothetical protein